ncbi:MAG: hypothetical protein Q8Q20_00365 [bacterium]|nr:hypothetical protein [bacterium]
MIILNLLSSEKKEQLQKEIDLHKIRNGLFLVVGAVVLSIAMLLSSHFLIRREISEVAQKISETQQVMSANVADSSGELIEAINTKAKFLDEIQSSHIRWQDVLAQVSETANEGIQIENLDFDSSLEEFTIKGFALDRDSLLEFKQEVETIPFFENIVSPIADLIQRENITFEFSGRLNKELITPDAIVSQ